MLLTNMLPSSEQPISKSKDNTFSSLQPEFLLKKSALWPEVT